jgi:glycosyltransferase involved in cell wall biosynthesis
VAAADRTRTLYYFTHSFPYGLGELWKYDDLRYLAPRFARTVVVPYTYAGNRNAHPVPDGVVVWDPLFDDGPRPRRAVTPSLLPYVMREFFTQRVYRKRSWVAAWLNASRDLGHLVRHPRVEQLRAALRAGDVLCFFWGRGSCDIVPLLGRDDVTTVVKMHRYDLFEAVNNGYIPYHRPLLEHVTLAGPSSEAGAHELRGRYPDLADKVRVIRMGTTGNGPSPPSTDGVLRIVSCSLAVPVKRLDLLVAALARTHGPVEWCHVGDGPMLPAIRAAAAALPSHVHATFAGHLEPRAVLPFYRDHPIDLFVNVSESEGVPFSIMEALSASIPALATDVGGTAEIVDDAVGRLVSASITPDQLAAELDAFHALAEPVRKELREAARRRWEERCDADRLAPEFADLLVSLR